MHLNIRSVQATGDGQTDDTEAFEKAIQLIAHKGGGRLILPSGHYRLRPVNLTSHLVLYLQQGAQITAIAERWPIILPLPSYGRGRDHPGPRYSSLIHGEGLENVTIQGDGPLSIIDGNGKPWWDAHHNGTETITRGHLIEFLYSRDIVLRNLTLRDSPFWTNHFFDCDNVHVQAVHVRNAQGSPNTDGWDPDSCRNVLIEDSTYVGADDCVAIKSGWDCAGVAYNKPSVNITIRNVSCHGEFAGIAIGSEMSGGVENVLIENVHFTRANKPINIKVGNTRGGFVKNIVYRKITVEGVIDQAIHLDGYHYYNNPNPECPQGWRPPAPVQVSNVSILDIDGRAAKIQGKEVFHFVGLPEAPFQNIRLQNVYFQRPLKAMAWNCSNIMDASVGADSVRPWPPCPEFRVVRERLGGVDWEQNYVFLLVSVTLFAAVGSWTLRKTLRATS